MASTTPTRFTTGLPNRVTPRVAIVVCMIAFVALMRLPEIGNPVAGLDEQFYLLVGERMWDGVAPYTGIWDRKPAGLFILYAILAAMPGDGVIAYQLAGMASLAATGVIAARITLRALPLPAALVAGAAVIFYGALFGSGFGEAPIFYDLLTVIAGALVLRARAHPSAVANQTRALGAMALCGVALTLKTSAVFECIAFGLLLVAHDRRRLGRWQAVAPRAALYVAIGLAPTLAIAIYYGAVGAFDTFWFANYKSVFLRTDGATTDSFARCVGFLLLLSPLILPTLAEWRGIERERRLVLTAWTVAGFLSFVAIGHCFDHYVLPLVTPLALLAAYGIRKRLVAAGAGALLLVLAWQFGAAGASRARYDEHDVAAITALIPPSVTHECLLVYEGPSILYQRTHACLPGRYVFPGHFTDDVEFGALEKRAPAILEDALARRPGVIVMTPDLREGKPPTVNDRLLRATLRRDYYPIGGGVIRLYAGSRIRLIVWKRSAAR